MIVVDTSAIVAILLKEPEADPFAELIADNACLVAAPAVVEASIAMSMRLGAQGERLLADFLREGELAVEPFDLSLATLAGETFSRFGKGRHPARLNFGDCMSYALAKSRGLPLLYKGGDFALTDIRPAHRP